MEYDEYKYDLLKEIAKMDNEVELEKFFKELLTESEVRDLVVRWAILNDLMQNVPQREIAKKYGTSVAKVNKGSNQLKNKSSHITKMLKYRYDETFLKTSL